MADLDDIQIQTDQFLQNPKFQPGKISASTKKINLNDPNQKNEFFQMQPRVMPVEGQGRVITENEEKLRLAIEENEALDRLYGQKL